MASLPKTSFTLKGGCFCSAIRYTIQVPPLSARPIIPVEKDEPIGVQDEVTARLPLIDLDHCNSCRRISGSVLEFWLIIPQSWVRFSLLPKDPACGHAEPATVDVVTGKSEILESTFLSSYSSSEGVKRSFCGRCGTNLTFHYTALGGMAKAAREKGVEWEPHMDVTLGSLDREGLEMEGMRPTEVAFPEDGIGWVKRLLKEGEKCFSEWI
ncbi:Mss4-like protein [Glarea lozoyensis ATCC 20868]|uniref:Mss4-like protein n=1 Tax=Glarea lozoyensis (strain ATCC 20868 / MF5171) TaxID=1116229 RepID=S3CYJ3_GLAL2|nr:Mss4-like protein [Glarea lozoyensis ATCC 20868]EPE30019.1 Mss4-like protein [Glarea lozoyensis ATCC 20868]